MEKRFFLIWVNDIFNSINIRVYPLFLEARNEEDIRGIVHLDVAAWNCGIIKATRGEKELIKTMNSVKNYENIEIKKLIDDYIIVKCTKYDHYIDFITHFEMSFEKDGKLNFSVLTEVNDQIMRTLNSF